MLTEPTIEARAEQPYVSIPISASLREWGTVNALVPEVYGWLAQKGIAPAGPLFYRYRVAGDWDRPFDLEVGVPVPSAVPCEGRLTGGAIPSGSYATATHNGHPDKLATSITALQDWAAREGVEFDKRREGGQEVWAGCFEFYLTDPEVEPDLNNWQIRLAYKVKDQPTG